MGDFQSGESWRHKNVLNPIPASQEQAASLPNLKLITKYIYTYVCLSYHLCFVKFYLFLAKD